MLRGAVIACVVGLLATAVAPASADSKRKKAREHFNQGEMYMQAAVYDLAIREYQKAYVLVPSAHGFLFNVGLAYQKWGKLKQALNEFRRYLKKQPRGDKAPETRARIIALERALSVQHTERVTRDNANNANNAVNSANNAGNAGRPDANDPPPNDPADSAPPPPDEPARVAARSPAPPDSSRTVVTPIRRDRDSADTDGGVEWGWLAAGAGLVGMGLLIDVGLDSSNNGSVNAIDFVPLALYGAGGFFVIRGVF